MPTDSRAHAAAPPRLVSPARPESTGLQELMAFLVDLSQRKSYGRVEFYLDAGQIRIVKFEQHFRPSELKDRSRAPGNAGAAQTD